MRRAGLQISAVLGLCLGVSGCHGDFGPHWYDRPITPEFVVKQDSLSTAFTGHVSPEQQFVFGVEDGLAFTRANVRLTIEANTVWAYQPVVVSLYDGSFEQIGRPDTLVAQWSVPAPELDGTIQFVESIHMQGRVPTWATVDLVDFAGICIIEVLSHE